MPASSGDVLIVEDTPASLQLLSDLLTHAGYAARRARDGKIALLSAQAEPPELILLDVRMPDIDGYEVCRRLKADPRTHDVPVIFLSALRDTEDKVLAFQVGAADYIAKPYQPDEVLARVRTHIELGRLRARLEERVQERTAQYVEAERKLRDSQAQLQQLAGFLQTAREEERTRIARELHDELGQALTVLRIDLGWLRNKCSKLEAGIVDRLAAAYGLTERTIDALRRISEDLRPAMLDDLGLAAAIEHHVTKFSASTGIACTLSMNREEFEMDEKPATAIFRLVQEALTNAARHADAKSITVRVEETAAGVRLAVADDGRGFAASGGTRTFGLLGMRERVKMLGGELDIESAPGAGTRVEAWLPRTAEAAR
ncbi:MAG: response regulator [Rhodocyclaceae bacterium]|nr:response regulator [Rhodocyclaceae bacterium]